jgi:hypothetical protein
MILDMSFSLAGVTPCGGVRHVHGVIEETAPAENTFRIRIAYKYIYN